MKPKVFNYGKYSYEYSLLKSKRKTISLVVKPDKSLIVKAPLKAKEEEIEKFLKRKWSWMEKQIRFFDKYNGKKYKKDYISGESFYYLGRQYKLKVKKSKEESVKLQKGVIELRTKKEVCNSSHNKNLLSKWYSERAEIVFRRRYQEVLKSFSYKFVPVLDIRKMSKRWGSFLSNKKVYLNIDLIKVPTSCIDYVITHELCHMKHKRHDKDFYKLLTKKCSDWEERKEKLEMFSVVT